MHLYVKLHVNDAIFIQYKTFKSEQLIKNGKIQLNKVETDYKNKIPIANMTLMLTISYTGK